MRQLTADTKIKLSQIKDLADWHQQLVQDKHSPAREGDVRQWADGKLHRKTKHGWETIKKQTKVEGKFLESYSKTHRQRLHEKKQRLAELAKRDAAKKRKIQIRKDQDNAVREAAKTDFKEISPVKTINEIPTSQFLAPTKSFELPATKNANGNDVRPVLIKKSIFIKNKTHHPDLTPEQSKEILNSALYGEAQAVKETGENSYTVLITGGPDRGKVAVVDTEPRKDRIELVGWRFSNKQDNERLKKKGK